MKPKDLMAEIVKITTTDKQLLYIFDGLCELSLTIVPFTVDGKNKIPSVKGWHTDNETKRGKFTSGQYKPNALGLVLPDCIGVVDLDIDKTTGETVGVNSFQELCFVEDLEYQDIIQTTTVTTPSGGIHLYYEIPEDQIFHQGAGQIDKGIDTRSPHVGLIIIPPSDNSGFNVKYAWRENYELMVMPQQIIEASIVSKNQERSNIVVDLSSIEIDDIRAAMACDRAMALFSKISGLRGGDDRHMTRIRYSKTIGGLYASGYFTLAEVSIEDLKERMVIYSTMGDEGDSYLERKAGIDFDFGFDKGLSEPIEFTDDEMAEYIRNPRRKQ